MRSINSETTSNEVRNQKILFQNEGLREWLQSRKPGDVSDKYERRHQDSVLLKKLKDGLRAERNNRRELENSLVYSGVNTSNCQDLLDCGDSLSECLKAVDKVSYQHENDLARLRNSIAHADKRSNNKLLQGGMNPATVITEFRRKLILHAMMDTGEVAMKREEAADILDLHIAAIDPKDTRIKAPKVQMLDSLDVQQDIQRQVQHHLALHQSRKLHESPQWITDDANLTPSPPLGSLRMSPITDMPQSAAPSPSPFANFGHTSHPIQARHAEEAHPVLHPTGSRREYLASFDQPLTQQEIEASLIARTANAACERSQPSDDDDEDNVFESFTQNEASSQHRVERRKSMPSKYKISKDAFRTPQSFHPEWGAYDVMRHRWRSVRPTPAKLN